MNDTKNFKVSEFTCHCGCGFNIIDQRVMDMCQVIRDELGVPVRVSSGCRCEKRNKAVGGTKGSFHTKGKAADLTCSLGAIKMFETVKKLKEEGKLPDLDYCILYKGKNIIHIDCGKKRKNLYEVNAKRYWQLLKNGITEDVAGDFASKYLKGQIANIPYFSYKVGKTLLFINLFSILLQAFNKLFWLEDEDKLPPEIAGRPHITLGHDSEGNVLYFSQVGSLFDWLEWAGLDTFKHDVKQIFNGQLTVTDWLKHMASAPFNKIINGLNPFLKTPFEIGSGMSFYPSVTEPRIIRDRLKYLAQQFGVAWPYKAITGEPRNNWHEFRNLFIYSQDAEQAAYFYILNLVNQFREKELGETFSGFRSTKRSNALRDFKTALRFKDNEAARRSLNEYFQLGGKRQSLNTSIRNMHPLHSLNAKNKAKFLDWLSDEDKKFLESAEKYYQKQMKQFEEVISGGTR